MAITINLRVTPEQLKTQTSLIETDIANMKNDVNHITSEIRGTSGYWLGDAGNKQRNDYNGSLQKVDERFARLMTYPERLLKMAGIYEETEEANTQIGASLTTDIQMI